GGQRQGRAAQFPSSEVQGRREARLGREKTVTAEKRSLFGVLAQQRRFIYMATGVLSVTGILAPTQLPSAIYPELTFSRITIVAEGTTLGARQMLFAVTRPIEEAVGVVPGVIRVQSRSIRSGSETNVTFSASTDMAYALQQVQARVNQ